MGEYYFTYNTNANTYTTERSEAGTKWVKLNGGTGKKSFDTEPWTSNLDSTTYIQACDELENCSVKNNTIIKIDKTKPNTPTIVNINHNKWVKDSYGITVSSIDTAEGLSTNSGINEYYYSYNSNATEIGSNPDTQLVKLTGGKNKTSFDTEPWTTTMNKTTYVVVYDNAGNKSDSNSTIIKIDKTPPTKPTVDSYSEDSWYYTLTMTIRSSDAHSGIKSYQYTYNADAPDDVVVTTSDQASQYWRIESGAETTKTSYNSDFVGERDQKVYWRTCDQVGNCSEKTAGNRVRVDRTGPTCGTVTKTTSSSNQSTSGAAGSITCTDAKSGCKTQSFSGLTTTPKSTITIKDNVGNTSTCEVPVTRGNCVTYKCKGTIYPYSVIANGSSNTNSAASDYTEQQCRNVCGYPNGTNGIHYKWIANYFEEEISENVGRVHVSCSCTGSDHSSIGRCSWSGTLASCKTGGSSDLISCSYLINNRGCCGCCNAGIECTKYKYY